jgi:Carbohydrate-binding module 48 (Isoamylase N-terminal domain)
MNCSEQAREIGRWLEARWAGRAGEPRAELLEPAASCRVCDARLAAARLLADGGTLRREAPPWLTARVRQRLAGRGGRLGRRLPGAWPARLRWAAVPLAAVLAAALTFGLTTRFLRPAAGQVVTVRLELVAPGAASVSVVGDWNGWDPAKDRLRDPDGDGVWEIRLRLQRGLEARYQFLVDGDRWLADPRAPLQVKDEFGGTSSVLQI